MRFPDQYAVFDFETTSLDTQTCEVTEIGLKVVRHGQATTKTWLVRTVEPLSEFITNLTGITEEMLNKEGVLPHTAFREFWQARQGLPLVGHNIFRYDFWILKRYLEKIGIEIPRRLFEHGIDTAALFKARQLRESPYWYEGHYEFGCRVLEIRAPIKYNLMYACGAMLVDLSDMQALHRAGADVEACDRLFRKLRDGS